MKNYNSLNNRMKKQESSPVWKLIKTTFRYYPKAVLASIPFFAIIALLLKGYKQIKLIQLKEQYEWILFSLGVLIVIYLCTAMIYSVSQAISANTFSLKISCRISMSRYRKILGFVFIFTFSFFLMTQWMKFLNYLGEHFHLSVGIQGIINLLLSGLPFLLFQVLVLITPIFIIIEDSSLFRSVRKSTKVIWRSGLKSNFFLLFMISFLFYLVMPGTLHENILSEWHLDILFNLLMFILLGPLILNYMILLASQLKKEI